MQEAKTSEEDIRFRCLRKVPVKMCVFSFFVGVVAISAPIWLAEGWSLPYTLSRQMTISCFLGGPLVLIPGMFVVLNGLQPWLLSRARRIARERGVRVIVEYVDV